MTCPSIRSDWATALCDPTVSASAKMSDGIGLMSSPYLIVRDAFGGFSFRRFSDAIWNSSLRPLRRSFPGGHAARGFRTDARRARPDFPPHARQSLRDVDRG